MEMIERTPLEYRVQIMSCLAPMIPLDSLLLRLGADKERPPASYVGRWPDHLAWAVDSAVAAARLLLCGQIMGAAAVARNQLERWLMHRAFNAGLTQQPGESTVEYVARVWSVEDNFHKHDFTAQTNVVAPLDAGEEQPFQEGEPVLDHAHVRKSNGEEICPAVLYIYLSEMMHARALPEAVAWDGDRMLHGPVWPDDLSAALGSITDSITLCLRQVRVAAATLAQESGDTAAVRLLQTSLDTFSEATDAEPQVPRDIRTTSRATFRPRLPPLMSLAPLLPREGLLPKIAEQLSLGAEVYLEVILEGKRPAGRLYRDDELATLGFVWHRSRSLRTAARSLDHEQRILGDDFDEDVLTSRASRWVLLTELASMLGHWHTQPEVSVAASAVGSGLRSSYWLWLEDDDRAMSVLRCVLEQTARLRTWRLKPAQAARLEVREATTPRDWLEQAGWRRLSPLNRALGEFAHTKATSKWAGARELLAKLHPHTDLDQALLVARGASVDLVAELAAAEVHAHLDLFAPDVAAVVADLLQYIGLDAVPSAARADERFERIWKLRREGLGAGAFA